MKRFILYSLSATVALTFGSIARADMYENQSEMMDSDEDLTEGVIAPDSTSPNNRAVPGEGAIDGTEMTSEDVEPTESIIVPDSDTPSNRAIPGEGSLDGGGMTSEDAEPTEGIIVPDSSTPSNRAVPSGDGVMGETMTYQEAFDIYRETGEIYPYDAATGPAKGIIVPNDNSPSNRAVPGAGAIESGSMMNDSEEMSPTDGIIVPESNEPSNRSNVEGEGITDDADPSMDADPTDGIIVPESDEPNNRAEPGNRRY